jgi:hypothetical protein
LLFASEKKVETAPGTQKITGTKLCLIASKTQEYGSRTLPEQIAPGTHLLRAAGMQMFLVAHGA